MTHLLAFPVFLQPSAATGSGAAGEHVVAMDLFVLINLGFLLFMLGFFGCFAWIIWRRTTKPAPHIQLLMELDEELSRESAAETEAAGSHPAQEAERAPWEREQDWWKK